MKKSVILLTGVLGITALAGCNLQHNKTVEHPINNVSSTTIKQQNVTTKQIVNQNDSLDTTDITLYIDKNCEKAGLQQCNPKIWENQFGKILKGKAKLKVVYTNKNLDTELKNIVPTTPVLSIPKNKIALFGKAAQQITSSGKLNNGVYYIPLFGWIAGEENLCNDGKDNNGNGKIDSQDPSCYKMTVLTSSKCKTQYCSKQTLKNIFMGYYVNILNYDTPKGKKLYKELLKKNGSQTLPTFLINKKHAYIDQMKKLVKEVNLSGLKYQINIPQFKYNPAIEACSTNCNASPACKALAECDKTNKPKIDLFVMAHCPWGTQAEKGILPVVKLLKNKIDFSVKFVDYDMHGITSINEDTLQHCIQKEEPAKYVKYLSCFLKAGNTASCEVSAKLDMKKENTCIKATNKKYNIMKDFNDKASYVGGQFPKYEVNEKGNKKYGVQGSPTLVINGAVVNPSKRSPQAYLNLICKYFKNKPSECSTKLLNNSYVPMYGYKTSNGKTNYSGLCAGKK